MESSSDSEFWHLKWNLALKKETLVLKKSATENITEGLKLFYYFYFAFWCVCQWQSSDFFSVSLLKESRGTVLSLVCRLCKSRCPCLSPQTPHFHDKTVTGSWNWRLYAFLKKNKKKTLTLKVEEPREKNHKTVNEKHTRMQKYIYIKKKIIIVMPVFIF